MQPGPGFDPPYGAFTNPTVSPTSSDPTLHSDNPGARGTKRKRPPLRTGTKPSKKAKTMARQADEKADAIPGADGAQQEGVSKAKRVRTGCLTCRERHLKCDEGLPCCNNCKKSNRDCKRGIKLNFIDIQTEAPPVVVSAFGSHEWKVEFQDESREIASEYQGGAQRYRTIDPELENVVLDQNSAFDYAPVAPPAPSMMHQPLPPMHGNIGDPYPEANQQTDVSAMLDPQIKPDRNSLQPPHSTTTTNSHYAQSTPSTIAPGSVGSYGGRADFMSSEGSERKEYLDNQDETLYMQVFVEEVGLWMDSMDPQKHFSRLLPFHALSEPMLLNAFLACGARHLMLVNPAYGEEKALQYYDTSTRYLLQNLQNPNRDTVVCATTAVILNVYEIMSERALQRMNHIAGARALIKECGWNARTEGIGQACFWLNVGLEVLSCLHFNWQVAWDPDDWGVDMDFSREIRNGREEIWTHRMLYIVAKVCNFRATIPRYQEYDPAEAQAKTQQRYEEWCRLKGMMDAWNDGIPRTMHPMAYLYPNQTSSKSAFPEVWLVKRSTIVARLFYHTAMLLIGQINPYQSSFFDEMNELQARHSEMICGIAAHVKDRGVASVAIRSLAHAAEVLTKRHEQEEVLRIFEKVNKETGWRIGFVYKELKDKWGWNEDHLAHEFAQTHTAARQQKEAREAAAAAQQQQQRQLQEQAQAAQSMQMHQQQSYDFGNQSIPPPPPPQTMQPTPGSSVDPSPARKKMPQGIPNPMYAKADFNLPQHPYQNFYVAPNHVSASWNLGGGGQLYYNV